MIYFNENDPFNAQWLRNLISAGHLPAGDVDDRDIRDVCPDDLRGYTQCHFFAGIGGWAIALRLAGWADDRPAWTGSCPCQPFSQTGRRGGFTDERHLWPAFFHLIRERRPSVLFGEQVSSPDAIAWLDLVSSDMEGEGYRCAPLVLPACSVGAPHIRHRLWIVADAAGERCEGDGVHLPARRPDATAPEAFGNGEARGRMADAESKRRSAGRSHVSGSAAGITAPTEGARSQYDRDACSVGDARLDGNRKHSRKLSGNEEKHALRLALGDHASLDPSAARPIAGFWGKAEWVECTDGKSRAIEPGIFPLAHGFPGRVGSLRAAGNAIVPQVAAQLIAAYMEVAP